MKGGGGTLVPVDQNQGAAVPTPPLGRLYEVSGRMLALHKDGAGGPPVVFLPGATLVGLDYLNVHRRVSQFTTSVIYDRAGTGWSDAVRLPRNATEPTLELRTLLKAAEVRGPYIFVAHSLGGVYARRYSQLFPDEVAGLLLLDVLHEDWDTYLPEGSHLAGVPEQDRHPDFAPELLDFLRDVLRQRLVDWPPRVRDLLIEKHLSDEWFKIGATERSNLAQLAEEMRGQGDFPDVPLIVMSALGADPGQELFVTEEQVQQINDGKMALDDAIARSVPQGEHRVVQASQSTVTIDAADEVVTAIRDLVEQSRTVCAGNRCSAP
ncbi:Pimeloyl-ACP methyl ester carboxylesterase [Kibdelosporangium aridum]|uniref:Pimeloyl-ACP methyl ester carboxylesterase n=1 Tax=Kibdelosporangium aridum TaxID=2030 RepID=A0A1W2AF40_KIBAR|nr:Pimeloyl-ACP methyl ester carboxylesterase [Kibdelosporangium aridum]